MPHPPGLLQGGNDVDTKAESVIFLKLPSQESCTKIVHFEHTKGENFTAITRIWRNEHFETHPYPCANGYCQAIYDFSMTCVFSLNPLILAPDRPNVCDCGWES